MNKVYKRLLQVKIDNFLNEYFSSRDVFEDLRKRNKLLHSGEYGMYREKICDELIKFTIPSKFETGTGFLINSKDEVSKQCDILIFDKNNTPLIENDSKTRFFPVESVVGVGEIKSKLSISSLCEAAVILAEKKKTKSITKEIYCVSDPSKKQFDSERNGYDTMFSFIICEEIERFDSETVFSSLNKTYTENQINYQFRHNAIISLKDGVLTYKVSDILDFPKDQKMFFPKHGDQEFDNYIVDGDSYNKIAYFLTSLTNFLVNVNIYYPEPITYS